MDHFIEKCQLILNNFYALGGQKLPNCQVLPTKALRPDSEPRFDTVNRVCKALGVRLVVQAITVPTSFCK